MKSAEIYLNTRETPRVTQTLPNISRATLFDGVLTFLRGEDVVARFSNWDYYVIKDDENGEGTD